MSQQVLEQLAALRQADPVAAPLALLQTVVLRAVDQPCWEQAVPSFDAIRVRDGLPLLHGTTIVLAEAPLRRLALDLADSAGRVGAGLQHAIASDCLPPFALARASICQDSASLVELAATCDVDLGVLSAIGQLAVLPLLLACGRAAAPLLESVRWEAGYCPVCAGWPTLAELRGLQRRRWLRCGRCGSSWWCYQQRCSFCATADHKLLGYLAPEDLRDSSRATTCDGCRAYLKTFSTVAAIPATELGLRDLTSLELDVAAMEQDYSRPEESGFPLEVTLVPAGALSATGLGPS